MPPDAPIAPIAAAPSAPPAGAPAAPSFTPPNPRSAGHSPARDQRIASGSAAPNAAEWLNMSPDQRANYQRSVTDAGRTSAGVHTRTADGRVLIDGLLPDGSTPQADGTTAPADGPAPTDGGEKFKVGEFEVSEQEVRDLLAGKAERDLARTQIPAAPGDYQIEVPAESGLPEGTALALKNDPASKAMIEAAQNWAHKHGLSQSAFNELVAIQAHGVVAERNTYNQLAAANLAALGANGPQRIDAMTTWIRGTVGDADAKPIIATMATAAHVKFYEKLFQKVTNPGGSNFTQSHRANDDGGKVDDATYNSWSYAQKRDYAERMNARTTGRRG
jgi:hypothetical protein